MRSFLSVVPLISFLTVMLVGVGEADDRPVLQIINGGTRPIEIFWLKSDSERVPNGTAAPGDSRTIETTIGHRFAIVGGDDGVEAEVTATLPVQAFRFEPPIRTEPVEVAEGRVVPTPEGVAPSFYAKFISARGYPIVASGRVDDYALKEAAFLVNAMLAERPDVRKAMIQSGSRLCIMAHDEFTTDLPEFQRLGDSKARKMDGVDAKSYWDARARGLGGSRTDPYCTCAEENLLGFEGDPYSTENILIHEFAHNIHLRGMVNVDPTFEPRLKETYGKAMAEGLWKGKYAAVDYHEYFAEGVQSWFDDNRENDHDHNHVNTRAELLEYDPGLAALCREVFGETVLVYTKPAARLTGHLVGYDPSKAPKFVWPARLDEAREAIRRQAQERDRKANR